MSDLIIQGLLFPLQAKVRLHIQRAAALGIPTLLPSDGGYRTPEYQIGLYGHGRDVIDGEWVVVDPSAVVTHALPASAPHCRRAAYDLVPLVRGRPTWDRLDLFAELGRIGKELGLVWGGDWRWKDLAHFELPEWRHLPVAI